MAAPPTPPPMTTARAADFNSRPSPRPSPQKGGGGDCYVLSGAGLGRLDGRCLGRVALRQHVIDDTNEQDQPKGELEYGNVGERTADRDVWQRAERRVLAADGSISRPQEVDLHGDAPDEGEDVDDRAPLAQLEGRGFLGPATEAGDEDGEVAEDVR